MCPVHPSEQQLEATPGSVREARRVVADAVGDSVDGGTLEQVLLATSEIVTNAVEHGAPPIELRVGCADHNLRIEVRDASPLPPRWRGVVPGPGEVRGRGLLIVERCTDRWGVDEAAEGKSVWFELDV